MAIDTSRPQPLACGAAGHRTEGKLRHQLGKGLSYGHTADWFLALLQASWQVLSAAVLPCREGDRAPGSVHEKHHLSPQPQGDEVSERIH